MTPPRITHATLHPHGAGLLPDDLEEADWLVLDGRPLADPSSGDVLGVLNHTFGQLAPILYLQPHLRVVATLGGHDPDHCVSLVAQRLGEGGNPEIPIAIVRGGVVLSQLEEFLAAGETLSHTETGKPFTTQRQKPVAATIATTAEVARAAMTHGRVTLLPDAKPPRLEQAASGERMAAEQELELAIRYVAEHRFSCGLLGSGPNAADHIQTLAAAWRERLAAAGNEAVDTRIDTFCSNSDALSILGIATSRHPGDQGYTSARQSRSLLLQSLENDNGFPIERHPDLGPSVRVVWDVWPTTLRSELVEWSVLIRTAAEWADR